MTTFAPCFASSSATDFPMPLFPPVTMATLFASVMKLLLAIRNLDVAPTAWRLGLSSLSGGMRLPLSRYLRRRTRKRARNRGNAHLSGSVGRGHSPDVLPHYF